MESLNTNSRLSRDFSPDARYLIGVSGGRDSVALLHWLISLGYKDLIVCHLNHQLRGSSGNADARFVENVVERYNQQVVGQALLPRHSRAKACRLSGQHTGRRSARPTTAARLLFEPDAVNVRVLASKNKISIETAAREARYAFFSRIANRWRCHTIFLAHHADDLVETFLINLFRGAGSTGLGSIREISARRIDNVELTMVRPLLRVWREQINAYVRQHRLKFREDATNENLNPLRNRIRHRLVPYLEKMLGRRIRQNIWRTATIAAEEEKWIESELVDSTHADLSVRKLREMPVALQRRTVLKWLRAQNIREVGFDAIERVRSLADHDARTAKINLPRDRHARRRGGKIFLQ